MLILDVLDDAFAVIARIRLDVDSLERVLEVDVLEGDAANAGDLRIGRERANRHSDAEHDTGISHEDVLGAPILSHLGALG